MKQPPNVQNIWKNGFQDTGHKTMEKWSPGTGNWEVSSRLLQFTTWREFPGTGRGPRGSPADPLSWRPRPENRGHQGGEILQDTPPERRWLHRENPDMHGGSLVSSAECWWAHSGEDLPKTGVRITWKDQGSRGMGLGIHPGLGTVPVPWANYKT